MQEADFPTLETSVISVASSLLVQEHREKVPDDETTDLLR